MVTQHKGCSKKQNDACLEMTWESTHFRSLSGPRPSGWRCTPLETLPGPSAWPSTSAAAPKNESKRNTASQARKKAKDEMRAKTQTTHDFIHLTRCGIVNHSSMCCDKIPRSAKRRLARLPTPSVEAGMECMYLARKSTSAMYFTGSSQGQKRSPTESTS